MRSQSLFETHQETNSQIEQGVIASMKTYKFYVFLDRQKHEPVHNLCAVQKLSVKLKERLNNSSDKYTADYNKHIQLSFHDLQDQNQTHNALVELKNHAVENKTRIVVYAKQSTLMRLCDYAKKLNLKIESIPLVLYSMGLNNDLSTFLGWGNCSMGNLFSILQLQPEVRKWIMSPIEKIDTWSVQIRVHEDIGQIYRYDFLKDHQFMEQNKQIKVGFISHVSIGYHPQLNYNERKITETSFFDKFRYKFQGFKNFCCVGSPNMKTATGVVNVNFIDEKGDEREIFKEFKDIQNSQEINKHAKKRILSIVVTNIDRYNGEKIQSNSNFKMNDNKIQLHTFSSLSSSEKIATVSGDIKMTLESERSVFVQINDQTIRLINPKQIIITKAQKRKVLINKDTLEC